MKNPGVWLNALFAVLGVGGVQYASLPPDAQHWLSVGFAAWGVIGILLHYFLETKFGQKLAADAAAEVGLSADDVKALMADLPQKTDVADLAAAIAALQVAVAKPVPAAVEAPK